RRSASIRTLLQTARDASTNYFRFKNHREDRTMMRINRWGRSLPLPILFAVSLMAASPNARLVDAVKNTDRAAIRSLVEHHADVNAPDADGATPLHWAARWDDIETAKLLIASGADVKAKNRYDVAPLSLASTNGSAL